MVWYGMVYMAYYKWYGMVWYDQTIKMLKLMAGRMTSLAPTPSLYQNVKTYENIFQKVFSLVERTRMFWRKIAIVEKRKNFEISSSADFDDFISYIRP